MLANIVIVTLAATSMYQGLSKSAENYVAFSS